MEIQKQLIEHKALDLLDTYSGANNYILYMKSKMETNKKFFPTRTQADYIVNYFDTKPKVARKWVDLDTYFAKKFAYKMSLIAALYLSKESIGVFAKYSSKMPGNLSSIPEKVYALRQGLALSLLPNNLNTDFM